MILKIWEYFFEIFEHFHMWVLWQKIAIDRKLFWKIEKILKCSVLSRISILYIYSYLICQEPTFWNILNFSKNSIDKSVFFHVQDDLFDCIPLNSEQVVSSVFLAIDAISFAYVLDCQDVMPSVLVQVE